MRFFQGTLVVSAVVGSVAVLNGCASNMIEVRDGSDRVSLADASQVTGCQRKGVTTVSVIAKVAFVSRSIDEVDANLAQLARNGAIDLGGDTIVKGERPEIGKRTFAIYKCRP